MFTSFLLLLGDFSSCVLFPVSELFVYVVTLRDRSDVRLRDSGTIPVRFSPSVLWYISICYGLQVPPLLVDVRRTKSGCSSIGLFFRVIQTYFHFLLWSFELLGL